VRFVQIAAAPNKSVEGFVLFGLTDAGEILWWCCEYGPGRWRPLTDPGINDNDGSITPYQRSPTASEAVLNYLEARPGPHHVGDVIRTLDLKVYTGHKVISRLVREGKINRLRKGIVEGK
jgi:hypothetical protein